VGVIGEVEVCVCMCEGCVCERGVDVCMCASGCTAASLDPLQEEREMESHDGNESHEVGIDVPAELQRTYSKQPSHESTPLTTTASAATPLSTSTTLYSQVGLISCHGLY